jgi:two-component system NtrC family sensor kinase
MIHDGQVIGAIWVSRATPGYFADSQVELLKTFADQAVIAIENVRLFTELQEKNTALTTAHAQVTEALEQQTATSEILRVISSSPTDVQPVFDTIAESAVRLCGAEVANVTRFDGEWVHVGAIYGPSPEGVDAVRRAYPMHAGGASAATRAIRDCAVVHLPDVLADAEYRVQEAALAAGFRAVLGVPMIREGRAIGSIAIGRAEPGNYSDAQVQLLQTFADQAVIAIENVRFFTELQTSNRDLSEALDTQTATSDILRVISHSQTDVQPVFEAIVHSAVRLLRAYSGTLTRISGDQIALAALTSTDDAGDAALRAAFPQALHSGEPHAQVIRDRAPLNIPDYQTDPRWPEAGRADARIRGYRSLVVVPMLRHDESVGTISVTRRDPGGFTDDEIALLKTFADQAVIAIENARLLSELQARTAELTRSVGELRALGEIGQAISSTLDLQTVLSTIVARATELSVGHRRGRALRVRRAARGLHATRH